MRVVKAVRVIKVVKAFMAVKAVEVDRVMVRAYILKVKKSADSNFQSKKICGKSA